MTIREMQKEILKLKKEKNAIILAHAYQGEEILEIADYVGDSFGLSVEASKAEAQTVLMCGVRFMAETVKILSPDKKVYLVSPDAGCPMAEQLEKEDVLALKAKYPGYSVVAYINTTSNLKTVCDVCVTSASAVKIVNKLDNKNIIFIPDINLGTFVQKQCPDKNIVTVHGGCPTHARISAAEAKKAKEAHPNALLLVHPECVPGVCEQADFIGSTTAIMKEAEQSENKEFIIGTENSIVEHLQHLCPNKLFYPLSKDLVCHNMKLTTLADVYNCLKGQAGEEILLEKETSEKARKCIDEMLRLG